MKETKRWAVATTLLAMAVMAQAEGSVTSPYSRTGYGILNDNASGIQRSMGGVGYAMQNGRVINAMNPASYSQVDSLTFLWDVGLDLTNLWSKEGDKTGYNFGGGLDYLTGQFRITKGLGGSVGLVPYSSVGYSFGNEIDDGREYRSGSGGLLQLYLGAGYEVFKGLSVGANVSYLFGTTSNTSVAIASSSSYFQRYMEVRDWNAQFGLQYAHNIGSRDRVVVGVTYQPRKSLHGHTWGTVLNTQDTESDTVGYSSLKGNYEMPHTVGVGVSYDWHHKLLGELDFTYQNWSDVKYKPLEGFEASNMTFDNRWKAAAGLQYTPNSRGSYLGSMAFRVGGYYNHDYMNVNGNNVRDYGATFGVGLPAPGSKTTVNIGFEWKHRYSAPTSLIKEDYFNITVSVNVNEMWFWKNKIR
ncbi:MAG: hypothetical protein IJ808_08160 [Muribaculaceae bacterium]|nr:hypothetical protein [Muribaculaceae bacterium]